MSTQPTRIFALATSLFLLVASSSVPLAAQAAASRPHVALLGFGNESGAAAIDAACQAASDSLAITIRQLPDFEILPAGEGVAGRDLDSLRAAAMRRDADFVLFGSISSPSPGSYSCSLSLFDRARGSVTATRKAEGLSALDIFEATDELIAAALEAMTGRRLAFGRLEFRNSGERGSYEVFLDGQPVGRDIAALGNVVAGEHLVRVTQRRMLGERELLSRRVAVAERGSAELLFSIPAILEEERERLESMERLVRSIWSHSGRRAEAEAKVAQYAALVAGATPGAALDAYRERALQLQGEWRVAKGRQSIETQARSPEPSLFDPIMATYLESASYPRPEAIRQLAGESAVILAALLELRAGKSLADGDLDAALGAVEGIMGFSRCLPRGWTAAYANAAAALADCAREGLPRGLESAREAFRAQVDAGSRFYALPERELADPERILVLASDCSALLGLDGVPRTGGPLLASRRAASPLLRYAGASGEGSRRLDLSGGWRLAAVDIGRPVFGAVAQQRVADEPDVAEAPAAAATTAEVAVPPAKPAVTAAAPSTGIAPESRVVTVAPRSAFARPIIRFDGNEYVASPLEGYGSFVLAAERALADDPEIAALADAYRKQIKRAVWLEFGGIGLTATGAAIALTGIDSLGDGDYTQYAVGCSLVLLSYVPLMIGSTRMGKPPADLIDLVNSR